ncbi:MAG: hypothetical protein JNK78_19235 [Planctomycetes bacterium]|nr:hypothetical protein [Planctomycetota bacterium]
MKAVRPLGALLLLIAAGCVTGEWNRAGLGEPVPRERLEALHRGADTLGACLASLGAPERVFEHDVAPDGSSGVALLWYWRDEAGFGVDVSAGREEVPGSVSFDFVGVDLPGCVLWFDRDLVLQEWRSGLVGDLLPRRVRPAGLDGG